MRRGSALLGLVGLVGTSLTAFGLPLAAQAAEGDPITGTIWQDYDANGVFDSFEDGLPGIEVSAYDSDGAVAGPVVTGADGAYTLPVTSDATQWRVEANVPDTPAWAQWRDSVVGTGGAGANGTTVQFVDGVPTAEVDFSFQVPTAFVENNPRVYIPILQFGVSDGESAGEPGSGVIFWDAQSASGAGAAPVPQTGVVPFSQVGATNGSAVLRAEDMGDTPTAFAAAYLRRHIGFGPGGIGAIYRVTPDGADWSAPTASADVYVNVADWGINLGGPDITADPTDPNGFRPNTTAENPAYDWDRDAQAWDDVGRAGLGLISMSPDERYLFAVNLHNRSLIRIDTGGNPSGAPVAVEEFELDAYFPDDSDIRPFGVSVDALTGTMYLTATNTAEMSQDIPDLHGYVYSFSAEAPGDLTEVLDFPLDFERGGFSPTFVPWATELGHFPIELGPEGNAVVRYPQPVVASVQVLHGDLILAIRDLVGDQFGNLTLLSGDPTDGNSLQVSHVRSEGDVFIAAPNGDGTFTLENNGLHSGVLGNGAQQGDQGPGGLRYFDTGYTPLNQDNESTGSVVVMPSRPDGIMTTGVHVANAGLQEGTRRLYQDTGAGFDPSGALIRSTLGSQVTTKGNGLGTASVLASAAPIEIGNYVWFDIDNDGIQDPDEPPVAGATVNLYEVDGDGNRTLVSTTITSASGEYYFSSNDAAYALQTNTDYVVGVDNPADYAAGGVLENWYPTVADTGDVNSVDADRNDSDGLVEETEAGSFPFAAITTGGPGENDHTIDFGYSNIDYEFDKRTVSGPTESPDDDGTWVVEYELVAENTGAIDGAYGLTDDLTGYGEGIEVVDTEVVSGPDGAALNPDWDGVDDLRVIIVDQPIDAQSTIENGTEHVYLIRVTVALTVDAVTGEATPTPEALTCTPDQQPGDPTTGLFNVATMDPVNHEDLVDTECGDLPLVTLDKTVTVEPHVVDPVTNPGEYEISYGLTVTNTTTTATDYDLEDRLRFGEGISIVEGSVVAANVTPGGVEVNAAYDGTSDALIVSDVPIAGGQVDTYTVTVRYTVELPAEVTDPDPSACGAGGAVAEGEESGLYNDANTSFNGYVDFDDECREVGEVTHDKSLISATPIGDGQWEVVYGVEVTNKGVEAVAYDLADELHFGEGITVASTEVTSVPDGVTPADPVWDGQDNLTVATGVTILGTDDDGYAPQQYVLTVIADVPLQLADPVDGVDPATCGTAEDGAVDSTDRAFNNVSTVVDEVGSVEEDDACAGPPEFEITKTVTDGSPVGNGDGTWTVTYEIEVTNTGELEGVYDVTDRLRFAAEAQIASSAVSSTPDGVTASDSWTGQGAEGAPENVIAADVALAGGATHTYQVQVVVAMVPEELTDEVLACPVPGSDENQGLANTAGLGHNDLTADAEACVVPPRIAIDKTIVEGPTQDGESYSITYQIEVTNTGGVTGSYDLSDQLRYGEGIEVDTAEVTQTPEGVSALETWTGQGEAESRENVIATDVGIDAGEVHVYRVTVTGTLDGDVVTAESLECGPDGATGDDAGLLNVAVADHNSTDLTGDACAPLLPPDDPGAQLPDTGANGLTNLAIGAGLLT
ncbi:SdrD B-like domain-containing protein, partial [Occultella gossypii]